LGEAGAYICNHCATAKIGRKTTLALLIMTVLVGIIFAVFAMTGTFSEIVTLFSWPIRLFFIIVMIFVVSFTIQGILELFGKGFALTDNDIGERAAIEVRKEDLRAGDHLLSTVFWTSKEYEKLIREQVY
jgi:hypothetical protein